MSLLACVTVQDLGYGWPLPALAERRAYPSRKTSGALAIPQWLQWVVPGPAVPVHPVLSGVVVDTLVHAPIWIVLLFVGGNVRRWRRRLVGLCPGCGYDLRATEADRCPECGRTTPKQHH